MTPETGLDNFFWQLLLIPGVIYVVLYIAANVLEARENPTAETLHDIGFGVIALAGVYAVILTVIALVSRPNLMGDLALTILIIVAFFALLVLLLYAIFELLLPRFRRQRG
jgi:polyferredoxin